VEISALRLGQNLSQNINLYIYDQYPDYSNNDVLKANFPTAKILSISNSNLIRRIIWHINSFIKLIGFNFSFYDFINQVKLKYYVKKHSINLINYHLFSFDTGFHWIKRFNDVKNVITIGCNYRDLIKDKGISKLQSSIIRNLSCIDGITYKTDDGAYFSKILPNHYFSNIKLKKIYNGIPENLKIKELLNPFDDLGFIFGMVARGHKDKGWDIAIESFLDIKISKFNKVSLVLVGEGDYLGNLKDKYSYNNNIHFIGSCSYPIDLIQFFNVGLLPSKSEAFPNVLLEYMLCSVPIIASNTGEIQKILTLNNNICGKIIDVHLNKSTVIQKFSSAMGSYLVSKSLYCKHKENTHKTIKEFGLNKISKSYYDFYSEII